jgi:hyperosmotically inducible protein
MRRLGVFVGALAALGAWGCSHESASERSASAGYAQAKSDFASAYDAVKSGARQTAEAGSLAFKGVGEGAVQVTDQSKEAIGHAGNKASDGWITTKVKSELAMTKGVKSGAVHVDTDSGVVRLSGTVETPGEAQRAIQTALKVKGVAAVDSNLQYPTEKVEPKIYTNPQTSY